MLGSETGPAKLFQSATTIVQLLKKPKIGDEPDSYSMVSTRPATWIQTLGSSSAEVLKAALEAVGPVSRASSAFSLKVRGACSDKLAANLKAERGVVDGRGADWVGLQSPCDVHIVASSQSKTYDLSGDFVSGMINLSLSLRLSGNMKRLRACVKQVVLSSLVILTRPASVAAAEYRRTCLDLFLARGTRAAQRRSSIMCWCNGDWRDHSCVQHYPDAQARASGATMEKLAKGVSRAIVQSLAGRTPSAFPGTAGQVWTYPWASSASCNACMAYCPGHIVLS